MATLGRHRKRHCMGDNASLHGFANEAEALADACRDLTKQVDHLYKLLGRVAESGRTNSRGNPFRALDEARAICVDHLKNPRYFWRQARWLQERFPNAELRDVQGLVKVVTREELKANDWSLTPGRYVGVAPEEEKEDFDFEEALREIHVEIEDLNAEAVELAAAIKKNFEELSI